MQRRRSILFRAIKDGHADRQTEIDIHIIRTRMRRKIPPAIVYACASQWWDPRLSAKEYRL